MPREVGGWLKGVVFPILVGVGTSAVVIDYLLAFIKLRLTPEVNWVGATYQPDGKGGFDVFTDSWVLDDSHGRVNATITKDDSHATWIGQGYSLHQVLSVAYKAKRMAGPALCRQTPRVGVVCPNRARTDVCEGVPGNGHPYRDPRAPSTSCRR